MTRVWLPEDGDANGGYWIEYTDADIDAIAGNLTDDEKRIIRQAPYMPTTRNDEANERYSSVDYRLHRRGIFTARISRGSDPTGQLVRALHDRVKHRKQQPSEVDRWLRRNGVTVTP